MSRVTVSGRICIKWWFCFQITTWTTLQGLCPLMTAGRLFRSPTPQAWALCPTPPTPHLIPGKHFSTLYALV